MERVISRSTFFDEDNKTDADKSKKSNSIPCFTLIPSFNFFQLFLIGMGYLPFSDRLLAQQTTDKYTEKDANGGNFNLNNFLNNTSIANRKEFFKNILQEHIEVKDEENKDPKIILSENENKFFDRNDFINKIKNFQESFAFARKMQFIELNEANQSKQIIRKLKESYDSSDMPLLFFTHNEISSSLDFPVRVLIQKKYDWDNKVITILAKKKGLQNKSIEEVKEILFKTIAEKLNIYYEISFIIGTKNGVPTLILFDGNKIVKIYDNKSEIISNDDELTASIDLIYMLLYTINGLNCNLQLKNSSSLRSKIIHSQISETDNILKEYIEYKLETNWIDKEFNFLELIKESLTYPAFFGFCSGFNLNICFYGSVILGTDKTSEASIIANFDSEIQQKIRQFIQTYGTFTTFTLTLLNFLEEIKSLSTVKDPENIIVLVKYLFGSVPAFNEVFFDLFVDFLLKIFKSESFAKIGNLQKSLKQYLLMTIKNKDSLKLSNTSFDNKQFSKVFSLSQRQGETATPVMATEKFDLMMKDQAKIGKQNISDFFTHKIKIEKDSTVAENEKDKCRISYKPTYIKDSVYIDYLTSAFYHPEVRL